MIEFLIKSWMVILIRFEADAVLIDQLDRLKICLLIKFPAFQLF
jgi:hypothetical protein